MNARATLLPPAATTRALPAPAAAPLTANAPPMRLPGQHFAAAMTFFALGTLCLAYVAPELASGAFLVPHVAAVVHLFTIGFISTSIFGALYQFLPVAVGTPIRSPRLADVSFALLVLGVPTFVTAMAAPMPAIVPVGGALVSLAFAVFAANFIATLAAATSRTVTWWALAAASLFLVVTLGFGFFLALDVATGVAGAARFELLLAHVHVALVGWVMLVMVGVGQRLLPMFMLSHGASERPARIAVACITTGCALLALPLGAAAHVTAALVIALGVAAFLAQAALFYRHRKKGELDPGMRLAMTGLGGVAAALAMAPFALSRGWQDVRLLTAYVFVLVVGGISLFIAGHYFKIVPFIVWYHRFGPRVGKGRVPRVAELYSERAARAVVVLLAAGVVVTATGILAGSAVVVRAGALLLFAGAALEAREMVRVARARPA